MSSDKSAGCASALLDVDGSVAIITLNRPTAFNALDIDMAQRLEKIGIELEQNVAVRVVVIRGSGRAFCAGGDIGLFISCVDDLAPTIRMLLLHLNSFLKTLRRMDKLVLTSVHGAVAGAGFSLAFMGDFCIAADTARFVPAYAQLGVSPDCGGTVGLVQALGPRRALQVFLDEKEINCERAYGLGLVTKVVSADALASSTLDYAKQLAKLNPMAASSTKRLIWESSGQHLNQQLELETESIIACMQTDDFRRQLLSLKRS